MTRATTTTGGTVFHANDQHAPLGSLYHSSTKRLKVAILGDFSGRQSRGQCNPDEIFNRPSYVINKDNFDAVFARFDIRLQLPISDSPIIFKAFDDLHPDYLYRRVPLFQQFIELNNQLLNPEQFEQAASAIQRLLGPVQPAAFASSQTAALTAQTSESTLDSILSRVTKPTLATPSGSAHTDTEVNRLIHNIVAPYAQQADDPRQADLLAAVSQATQHTMRSIMHHSAYQQLEASWRSVHWLIKRLDVDSGIEIYLHDITKTELLADLHQADSDLEQAQTFHRLVTTPSAKGSVPYHLVLGDFYVTDAEQDLNLLIDMGTIAESTGSNFICGASSTLAGFASLAEYIPSPTAPSLEYNFAEAWAAIRDYSGSQHVLAASPRFMLRQPYGKHAASTDYFEYEELGEDHNHDNYLWGNSGYLATLVLCRYFLEGGTDVDALVGSTVEDLALHSYVVGDRYTKPCAETLLTDRVAQQFNARGLCTVRSVHNQDKVIIPQLNSLHACGRLVTPWGSPARS